MLRSIKPLNRLFVFAAIGAAIVGAASISACTSTVTCEGGACVNPLAGGGGNGGGGGALPGADAGPAQVSAVLYGTDPLTLRLTTFPLSCANAQQDPPYGQCRWSVLEVVFPANLLATGPLNLANPDVKVYTSFSGQPYSPAPGDCPGTGGSGWEAGTLDFVSVDPGHVLIDIEGFPVEILSNTDYNGMRAAPRCP